MLLSKGQLPGSGDAYVANSLRSLHSHTLLKSSSAMRNLFFAFGILFIAVFAAISTSAQQARPSTTQKLEQTSNASTLNASSANWEYRTIATPPEDTSMTNKLGSDGWELVSVVYLPQNPGQVNQYFKRRLSIQAADRMEGFQQEVQKQSLASIVFSF